MEHTDVDTRLSRVKTHWTLVFQAHQGQAEETSAVQRLLLRYYGGAYRYLLGTVHDAAIAEELTQDFAVRFLRGDFQRADPKRGRFRDFLKTALRHLVIDYWRVKKKGTPLPADSNLEIPAETAEVEALDREFLEKWREELLAQTWAALAEDEKKTGRPYHTVLQWKAEDARLSAAQLADRLGATQGKLFTEIGIRQLLYRARQRFAELLVDEVARSLPGRTPQELEQELIDLNLLEYCQSALKRRADEEPRTK
jgi:RNA polymerase sigma factor (sigma-70 family)